MKQRHIKPANVEEYVTSSVQTFLGDPPDSDYQRGFLGAMLVVAEEALRLQMDKPPFKKAEKLLTTKSTQRKSRSAKPSRGEFLSFREFNGGR